VNVEVRLDKCLEVTMLYEMSVTEIIEKIKELPVSDQGKVIDFVELLKSESNAQNTTDQSFENATDMVFAKHDRLLSRLAK
tara:strand:+ start:194 stop:436 length:243 start_codon:yes stop_codon:yes gene_type:complete